MRSCAHRLAANRDEIILRHRTRAQWRPAHEIGPPALVGPLTVCPVFCRCISAITSDTRNPYPHWHTMPPKRWVSSTSAERRLTSATPFASTTSGSFAVQFPFAESHLRGDRLLVPDLSSVTPSPFLSCAFQQTYGQSVSKKATTRHASSSRSKAATSLQCNTCSKQFGYWHSLRRHQKTCNENAGWEPSSSSTCATSEVELTAPVTSNRPKAGDENDTVDRICASPDDANSDTAQRSNEPSAEMCERFDKMAVMIDGRCRFQCDSCSYVAAGLASIRQHYTQHTGELPFACEQCGCRYRLVNSLRKHILRRHEKVRQYNCEQCGLQFTERRDLLAHRRVHASERLFGCDVCGAQFGYRASLKAHMRTHDSTPAFRCEECAKTFTHVSGFKLHMKRHRGELNYRCDVCDKAFVDKMQLRRHLAVHSEERPFTCDVCGATFKLSKYLQSHERTHRKKTAPAKESDEMSDEEDSSDESAVRIGRKRVPLVTKRRLSPSIKEERAKIVKSKKIRLLDCASAPITVARSKIESDDELSVVPSILITTTGAAAPSTSTAKRKSDIAKSKGRQVKVGSTSPPRTRFRAILPKTALKKAIAKSPVSDVERSAPASTEKSAVSKAKVSAAKPTEKVAVPKVKETTKSTGKSATSKAKESAAKVGAKNASKEKASEASAKSTSDENPPVIDCDDCQFTTDSMVAMLRHYSSEHPNDTAPDEWHTCFHCNYACKRKYDIKRHIVNVHLPRIDTDAEVLTCGICWHTYLSKSALRRHVVRKHFPGNQNESTGALQYSKAKWTRGYCCDICGRGYEKQRDMLAHREVYHATAQPMRWSAFQTSKGKLKDCLNCEGLYRAGRFFEGHACISKEDTEALEQRMAELLRAKPSYRCDICSFSFMWKPIFRQHREVTHAEAAPLNWDELEAVEVPYYCASCYMAFDEESAVAQHECVKRELEAKPKSHSCSLCGGSYQRKSDYRRHLRLRHGIVDEDGGAGNATDSERRKPVIQCPYCETSALTRSMMVAHIKTAHDIDTESPFLCVVCNKVFKRKATLDTHNQVYHPQGENAAENERILQENQILLNGETAYHCNMCNRNMFNAIRFLAHHRLHFVERKFTCDLCGKQTRTQHQLNTHIKIIHLNVRDYECDICAKSFHSKQSCEEHRRIHTGERPFSCEICGKTFIAMNALFTHKKFHDDFFAHACHLCPKKFKVRRSLTNHIRTHTGERPFQCDMCSKTFNNSSRFSYHKKVTHSDNRPHKCTLCGSRFKANKFLLRHMKLHKTRTHIQFRRRNNPEYFAAQDAAAAAAATRNDEAEKGLYEIVNEEAKQVPIIAAVLQPQIEYKIIESGSQLATTVGSILYCDSVGAAAVVGDGKSFADIVDVSLRFAQNDTQLQSVSESFAEDASVAQNTSFPSSSAN